jgi:hypothetical protein
MMEMKRKGKHQTLLAIIATHRFRLDERQEALLLGLQRSGLVISRCCHLHQDGKPVGFGGEMQPIDINQTMIATFCPRRVGVEMKQFVWDTSLLTM